MGHEELSVWEAQGGGGWGRERRRERTLRKKPAQEAESEARRGVWGKL